MEQANCQAFESSLEAIKAALKEINMETYAKDIIKNHGTVAKCKNLTQSACGVPLFGERENALKDLKLRKVGPCI
jgi:hypothetical protein